MRGGGFPVRAARCLSLLLYSPAQDGKHIKCFPLRAELATNLTPAPSPETLPAVTLFEPLLLLAASRLGGPVLRGGVCLRILLKLRLWLKWKRGTHLHPPLLLWLL